jgi:hypothetical protein
VPGRLPLPLVGRHRLGQQPLGLALEDRVGTQAEGVRDAEPLAHVVHVRHAEGAVAPEVEGYVGPGPAQAGHQVGQVVLGAQGGMDVARPQRQHDELVRWRGGSSKEAMNWSMNMSRRRWRDWMEMAFSKRDRVG